MNTTFSPYLRKFIIIFFDDILIYSKTLPEHLDHLQTTFESPLCQPLLPQALKMLIRNRPGRVPGAYCLQMRR